MAEWLRRLTRNQFRSAGVGSNPTDRECFHFQCPNILLLILFSTALSWCPAGSTTGIVGSVVECSPATRAARVRFPDDALKSVLFRLLDSLCVVLNGMISNFCPLIAIHPAVCVVGTRKIFVETGGIDPPTSHMLSEHSTI